MDKPHIVKSYDKELGALNGKISDIARMTRLQLDAVLKAFQERDTMIAEKIIQRDSTVDHLEYQINRLTVHLLAARQPMAVDLRTVISALKIGTDIERVADYVVNIAKQVVVLNGCTINTSLYDAVVIMIRMTQDMLSAILEAYTDSDIRKALAVWERDKELDQLYTNLLAELRVCMMNDAQNVKACTALLFVARCLERMGDHIKNIAEDIYFIVTGEIYPHAQSPEDEGSKG